MPMTYDDFLDYRTNWEANGNRLMSEEDVSKFDEFFANQETASRYKSEGFTRALAGDFSQYETVEPMLKGYLGAKKCYELYQKYKDNAQDPRLHQELKERLMEVDLRTGFAFGGKDPTNQVSVFLRECERIANRQMLIQTLETPDPTAKLRLLNQLEQEDANTAEQKLNAALSKDLEQRVQIAKILFMNHLGKFQLSNEQQSMQMQENMAELYCHGGRTMFILPAGAKQKQVMNGIKGEQPKLSGIKVRKFATHGIEPRTFRKDGSIATEAEELKLNKVQAYSYDEHKGMNASIGGLGQMGPNGKIITSDGTNGHMYMRMVPGGKNTCGMMLAGFENAGPGQKGRLGHAHGASAKKAGSSAFLSDKSYLGKEHGGRVVDLSGLSEDNFTALLSAFEQGYRNAALAAQNGDPALLNACNQLLTGKLMTAGQLKGMLSEFQMPEDQLSLVDQAKAGYEKADGYAAVDPEEAAIVPVKKEEAPETKTFQVTQFAGFAPPTPPAKMKAPSLWDKFVHLITFHSKNSYVSRYERYQQTIAQAMETYKADMQQYRDTLAELKNGNNPRGLKPAYDQAVAKAKQFLGIASQNEPQAAAGAATSPEVAEQLENALLNSIFRQDGAQAEMQDQIRAQIRQTESFQKMLSTGDEQINSLLNNTTMLATLQASITGELMKNSNPAQVQNNEISQNSPELSNPSQNTLKLG